ncbi:hypothetical protein ACTFIR_005748 [Dictyostelium discoideum]
MKYKPQKIELNNLTELTNVDDKNYTLLDVKEEFVEQINIRVNNEIHTFFIIELDIIVVLFEFDYELRHISGKKNGIADFLSRKYDNFQWDESFLNKIKEEQINSEWLLEMKKNPNLCIEEINDICYLSEDGFKKLIIVDKETIHTVIREYHDTKYGGHHALDITYNNIRQDYYFKEMFSIIKRYIKSCATCQLNINRKDNGILQSLEIPFELPKTTYALNGFTVEVDQVCVIVCRLSKMVHIVPCHKTIDAQHTAQLLLNHVFRLHGYPRTIVSDRDPRFLSDIWGRWAKTMDSKLKMTVAHRAQADGQTERMNREIKRILTKASTEYGENWSDIIPLIEFAMNSRRERENATTEAVEPIVSSPLSQEVQNSQPLQPITPRQQYSNSNQRNQSKKRKSRNQNTPSDDDDDDELDLSLQIKTTRSGRKVTPKRL